MAYLTQYSNSVPVIKFRIEQTVMTIGQSLDMDICIPEDGVADNHATFEAVKQAESYIFTVKSHQDESLLELNGQELSQTEIKDGDWLIIGGVEFQFTDDGDNEIKESPASSVVPITAANKAKPKQQAVKHNNESDALAQIKELNEEVKTMSTKEFIANSRNSRRRLNI